MRQVSISGSDRDRHDLCDPDRRDRPFGRILGGASGLVGAYVAKGGLDDRFAVGASVDAGNPVILAFLAAVAVGMACGALQGWAVTRLRVPPFVVTLGGLTAFRGAALLVFRRRPDQRFSADYNWWGQGRIGSIPVPVIIFFVPR